MPIRLKELRKNKGLNQTDLAKYMNVQQSTISNWESGKTQIDNASLYKLSELFEVSIDYILGQNNPTSFPNPNSLPPDYKPSEKIDMPLEYYKIPIYGSVRAGLTGYADDCIEGYERVSADEINTYELEEYFWLRVVGDSMEPVLSEDDLVLIHRQTSVDSGTLAVVLVDNEEGLIKYVEYGRDWIELISENEAYPPRRFEKKDVLRVYVIGEVIQSKRFYKKSRYKHI